MALVLRTFLTSLFAAVHCQALAPRAASAALPPSFSVTYLGQATSNFPNVTRDGGGGGTVNGENLIIFDDTEVHNALGNLTHFVPNSIAFVCLKIHPCAMMSQADSRRPSVGS